MNKKSTEPNGTWWHVTTDKAPQDKPYSICDTHAEAQAKAKQAKAEGHTNVKIHTSRPRSAR